MAPFIDLPVRPSYTTIISLKENEETRYSTIRYDTIWHNLISHDTIRHSKIRVQYLILLYRDKRVVTLQSKIKCSTTHYGMIRYSTEPGVDRTVIIQIHHQWLKLDHCHHPPELMSSWALSSLREWEIKSCFTMWGLVFDSVSHCLTCNTRALKNILQVGLMRTC